MCAAPTGEFVVVDTRQGAVRGFWRNGSAAFLGIPFAEPPFGERRFREPVRRAAWTGVRDALEYAATPQRKPFAPVTTVPEPSIPGDDTLNVNVFTPRPRPSSSAEVPLPVLVFVHGGGYIAGSPASPWYDGAAFNRDGVVTVTVSYRIGFDGFGWLPDAPANRAILDWLSALEWVRDNISGFGGDPGRVTIAGQSAGGGAVMTLLTMPRAQGLFTGVASLSGLPTDIPLDAARRTTAVIAARLGVSADRTGFAAVPERDLIEAQNFDAVQPPEPSADDLVALMRTMDGTLPLGPVVDGHLHQWTVEEGLRSGQGRDIPLLLGSTRQEFGGLAHANRHLFEDRDVAELLQLLGLQPETAHRVADALPDHHPAAVVGQHVSDVVFRRRIIDWVAARRTGAPTWIYDFAWRSPVSGVAEHCLDIPFAFDVLDDADVVRVAGPDAPQALADRMHEAIVRFARDNDPGWPAHDDETRSVMVFDAESHLVSGGYESARALS